MAAGTTPTRSKHSSRDRRARILNILRHWGDGETCKCVWCHRTLRNNPGDGRGVSPEDHVSVDHIVCEVDGGSYRLTNLVPSCQFCNKSRGRKLFAEFAAERGRDAEALIAHAKSYKRQARR